MEKFHRIYGKYPEYPVTDAGYGSFNNYLYCEEHGMGKYMKFTMYEKESKNIKYHNDPYKAVNFRIGTLPSHPYLSPKGAAVIFFYVTLPSRTAFC